MQDKRSKHNARSFTAILILIINLILSRNINSKLDILLSGQDAEQKTQCPFPYLPIDQLSQIAIDNRGKAHIAECIGHFLWLFSVSIYGYYLIFLKFLQSRVLQTSLVGKTFSAGTCCSNNLTVS